MSQAPSHYGDVPPGGDPNPPPPSHPPPPPPEDAHHQHLGSRPIPQDSTQSTGPPPSTQPPQSTQPPSQPQAQQAHRRPQPSVSGPSGATVDNSGAASTQARQRPVREDEVAVDLSTRERPNTGEMVLAKETMKDKTVKGYMRTVAFLFGAMPPEKQEAQEARKRALQQKYAGKWMYKTFAGKEKSAKVRKIAEMNYDKKWIRTGFFAMKGKASGLKRRAAQNVEMTPTTHAAAASSAHHRPQPGRHDEPESPRTPTTPIVKKDKGKGPDTTTTTAAATAYDDDDDWDDEDDEEDTHFPYFIITLTVLQLLVLGFEIWDSGGIEPFPENPFLGVKEKTLVDMGAKSVPKILEEGEGWRLISPILLHAGIIHYCLNMTFQLRYGVVLEKMYGWVRIGLLYCTCGVAGNLLSAIFLPQHLTVGASSALYGLLGCLLTEVLQNWDRLESPGSALLQVVATIIVSLILGLLPQIDNFAHIGGMFVGIFGAMTVLPTVTFGVWTTKRKAVLALVGFIIVAGYMVVGFGVLYGRNDPREWCSWCDVVNCVPIKESWCDSVNNAQIAPPPPPPPPPPVPTPAAMM